MVVGMATEMTMGLDWTQVLTIVGANIVLILGMLGVFVSLYIHTDSKMNTNLAAIQAEMKDFHEKLIRIEERKIKAREKKNG
jgi:type II secretory pathway component HofQ